MTWLDSTWIALEITRLHFRLDIFHTWLDLIRLQNFFKPSEIWLDLTWDFLRMTATWLGWKKNADLPLSDMNKTIFWLGTNSIRPNQSVLRPYQQRIKISQLNMTISWRNCQNIWRISKANYDYHEHHHCSKSIPNVC